MTTTLPSWSSVLAFLKARRTRYCRVPGVMRSPSIPTDNGAVSLCEAGCRAQAHGATLHLPAGRIGVTKVADYVPCAASCTTM
jgi:hypothetical protein